MVRQDYWQVEDDHVLARTGKPLAHWSKVLDRFGADGKATAEAVEHLQDKHGVPRAWARTLATNYLKRHG